MLSSSLIDSVDSNGRTPLLWEAMRGDLEAMQNLLDAGANPNARSYDKQTPIHWAAQAASSSAGLRLLLARGAEADFVDRFQRTALTYASCNQNDKSYLEPSVHAHVRINIRDCHDRTPSGYAAEMNRTRSLVYLLEYGADPHIPDNEGYTPLLEAVLGNHHGILKILLQRNIVCTAQARGNRSLLHLAALYGDLRTIQLLKDASLKNSRTLELDDLGFSPRDLMRRRANPVLALAFDAFLDDLDRQAREVETCKSVEGVNEEVGIEEYAAALEYCV